jgi:surface protein
MKVSVLISPSLWPRLPFTLLCLLIRQFELHRITKFLHVLLIFGLLLFGFWNGTFFVVCGGLIFLFFVAPSLAVFYQASAFNQDVSKWNTGAVTSMSGSKCTHVLSLLLSVATPSVVEYFNVYDNSSIIRSHFSHVLLIYFFSQVFRYSGFKRTLCGGQWQSLSSNSYLTSTGRLGCCLPGTYMSLPNADPFSTATSCAPCDSGRYSASDDDTSSNCPYSETSCPTHIGGTAACYDKLPNGDGASSATGNAGTLRRAVSDWIAAGGASSSTVVATYGPIENWDVSEVANMKHVFIGWQSASTFGNFNADLSKWNTSAVTNMHGSKCTRTRVLSLLFSL